MNETTWIETFVTPRTAPPDPAGEWLGPGDDAALIAVPPGKVLVATVDGLVEGKHFRPGWLSDGELAARLIAVTVSDLAAMGARPLGVLLSFETPTLPGSLGEAFFRGLDRGLLRGGRLLGGNVVATDGPLALTATALGVVEPSAALRRDRVRPGDAIAVSGLPGRAGRARERIEAGEVMEGNEREPWVLPVDRTPLGRSLSESGVRAAIDISDGLLRDLTAMLRRSGCGGALELGPYAARLEEEGITLEGGLGGGEDYELCVAGPRARIERAFAEVGAEPLFLGEAVPEPGLTLRMEGLEIASEAPGWDPFDGRPR